MQIHPDGRIQCRVRIEGSYRGEPFIYEDAVGHTGSQYILPGSYPEAESEEEKIRLMAGAYWWEEGNMSCDCNRVFLLPDHLRNSHSWGCGDEITIYRIIPIEGEGLPTLELQNH